VFTDRVIALIETHVNMAGIEKAKAGFAGLNLSTLALGAALGGLILVGKSALENTEAQEKAQKNLAQAAAAGKLNFNQLQEVFDQWVEANKRYIPDQYAAETALAAFVRAGANGTDAMRELNDALDLSTLRGLDLSDAQKQITLALTGSSKALKVLGITTDEYSAIMKDKTLTTEQKHLALLALIESKTKDGRKAQTELTQSTQALNKDWQDITTKIGPPLLGLFTFIVGKADDLVKALNDLGHNKDWNKAISAGLGKIQDFLVAVVLGFRAIVNDVKWLIDNGGKVANFLGGGGKTPKIGPKGYPVQDSPGTVPGPLGSRQLVWALGGEQFGGSQSIGGNRGDVQIHIGTFIGSGRDIDRLADLMAERLRLAGAFR